MCHVISNSLPSTKIAALAETGFFLTAISSFRFRYDGYQRRKFLCTRTHGSCQCCSKSTSNEASPLDAGHAGATIHCWCCDCGQRIGSIGANTSKVFEPLFQKAQFSRFQEKSRWIQEGTQPKHQLLLLRTTATSWPSPSTLLRFCIGQQYFPYDF